MMKPLRNERLFLCARSPTEGGAPLRTVTVWVRIPSRVQCFSGADGRDTLDLKSKTLAANIVGSTPTWNTYGE